MGDGAEGHGEHCYCDECKRLRRNAKHREYDRKRRANDPAYAERERTRKRDYMRGKFDDDPQAVRDYQQDWRDEHRDRVNERARKYQSEPESKRRKAERTKAWVAAHPERMRELNRNHYHAHRERIRVRNRTYQPRDPERSKQRHRERTWERRATLKAAEGNFTAAEFVQACRDFEMRCAYCHQASGKLTPDHLVPLARGGANSIDNIVPACLSCNAAKQARTPLEFLASPSGFARMVGRLA